MKPDQALLDRVPFGWSTLDVICELRPVLVLRLDLLDLLLDVLIGVVRGLRLRLLIVWRQRLDKFAVIIGWHQLINRLLLHDLIDCDLADRWLGLILLLFHWHVLRVHSRPRDAHLWLLAFLDSRRREVEYLR